MAECLSTMGEAQGSILTIMMTITTTVMKQKVEQTEFEVSLGCIRPGTKLASEQATTSLKIRV